MSTKPQEKPTISDRDQLLALARLVKRLRDSQTQYFRTRSSQALLEAKKMEAHVDAAVEAILHPPTDGLWDKM